MFTIYNTFGKSLNSKNIHTIEKVYGKRVNLFENVYPKYWKGTIFSLLS
jgi:hypothetical protein